MMTLGVDLASDSAFTREHRPNLSFGFVACFTTRNQIFLNPDDTCRYLLSFIIIS